MIAIARDSTLYHKKILLILEQIFNSCIYVDPNMALIKITWTCVDAGHHTRHLQL